MQGEEGPQGPPGEIGVKGDKVGELPGVYFQNGNTDKKRLKNPQILNWDSDSDENCKFTNNIYLLQGGRGIQGPQGAGGKKGENVSEYTQLVVQTCGT